MLTDTLQCPHQEAIESGQWLEESFCLFNYFHKGSSIPIFKNMELFQESQTSFSYIGFEKNSMSFWYLESPLPTRYKQITCEASLIMEDTLVISCKGLSSASIAPSCSFRLATSLPECSLLSACLNTSCMLDKELLIALERSCCLQNIRAAVIGHDLALPWPLFSLFFD